MQPRIPPHNAPESNLYPKIRNPLKAAAVKRTHAVRTVYCRKTTSIKISYCIFIPSLNNLSQNTVIFLSEKEGFFEKKTTKKEPFLQKALLKKINVYLLFLNFKNSGITIGFSSTAGFTGCTSLRTGAGAGAGAAATGRGSTGCAVAVIPIEE